MENFESFLKKMVAGELEPVRIRQVWRWLRGIYMNTTAKQKYALGFCAVLWLSI